jgi:uncharacterized LabA/DUF88 family protein
MRVGVYIDGYNLYYGGRSICGSYTTAWKWLDLRALAQRLIEKSPYWIKREATVERVVYCTSKVHGGHDPDAQRRQVEYHKALESSGSVDLIELGKFVVRIKHAPLATKCGLTTPQWPIKLQDEHGAKLPNARFMASIQRIEEKGSDVNVATHLLADVLCGKVDAAIVVTNDGDLRLPAQLVREHVPLAVVNPQSGALVRELRGKADDGVGGHWWYRLDKDDFTTCQLADAVAGNVRPSEW